MQPARILGDSGSGGLSRLLTPARRSYAATYNGQGKKLTDADLNLIGWLAEENRAADVRARVPSGWSTRGDLLARDALGSAAFSASTYHLSAFYLAPSVAYLNGMRISVRGQDTIAGIAGCCKVQLGAPPTAGTRDDLVYLEMWLQEVGPVGASNISAGQRSSRVWQDGHAPGVIDTTELSSPQETLLDLGNDLVDPTLAVETAGRVQVRWRIRVLPGVNFQQYPEGLDSPAALARGGASTPNGAYAFQRASGNNWQWSPQYDDDPGLWVAGDGSSTSANDLGNADGRVYAIPLAQVHRRNSTAWDRGTNANGAATRDSTYGLNGTVGAALATSATYRFSDRPDGRHSDLVETDDIVDMRHQVWLGAVDLARALDDAIWRLMRGTLGTRDVGAINTTYQTGGTYQSILNRLAVDQLNTGAATAAGATTTDSHATAIVQATAGCTIGTVPVRRAWSDATVTQRVHFAATLTNSAINIVSFQLANRPNSGDFGAPTLAVAPAGVGIFRADTGATMGPITTAISDTALTFSFTNPGVTSVLVEFWVTWSGKVGALGSVPVSTPPRNANESGVVGTPPGLWWVHNANGADTTPEWSHAPAGGSTLVPLPPGQQLRTTSGNKDVLTSVHVSGSDSTAQGQGAVRAVAYLLGAGSATVQLGAGGFGTSGQATLYGRRVLVVAGPGAGTPAVSSVTLGGDGSLTITFASSLTGGTAYSVVLYLAGTMLVYSPTARGVVDILRAGLFTATLTGDGARTTFTAIAPGPIAAHQYSTYLASYSAYVTGSAERAVTMDTPLGPAITFHFSSPPANGAVVSMALIYGYTPTTADVVLVHYRGEPYQGRAADLVGGYGSLATPQTVLTGAPIVRTRAHVDVSTRGTSSVESGVDWRAGSLTRLPMPSGAWAGLFVGDTADLAPSAPGATVAARRTAPQGAAGTTPVEAGNLVTLQTYSGQAVPTRGVGGIQSGPDGASMGSVKEVLETVIQPQSTAYLSRGALVLSDNAGARVRLLLYVQSLTAGAAFLESSGSVTMAADVFELPGRPLVRSI